MFFRSGLNLILLFKNPNQSSVKRPILLVGIFSCARIWLKYRQLFKNSFDINSHVFIIPDMAFVFLKFVFSIQFNNVCKVMIQLRNLNLTLNFPIIIYYIINNRINLNLETTFASTGSLHLALILLYLVFFEFSFCDRLLGPCLFFA